MALRSLGIIITLLYIKKYASATLWLLSNAYSVV